MLNVLFMLLPVGGACCARVILKLSKSPIDASKKFEEICKTIFFTPQFQLKLLLTQSWPVQVIQLQAVQVAAL